MEEEPRQKGLVIIDNSRSILVRIATLYAEKLLSDMCLVVGEKEFPCHRLILCASSEVFQVMLMNPQWCESTESRIVLVETKECSEIFEIFLKYFYTGKIRITLITALPILLLADKYNVKDLVALCVGYMTGHVAQAAMNGTLVSWFQYTNTCHHSNVATACKNFIKWNFGVMADASDFGSFEPGTIVNILQENDLVVYNEMKLYRYIVKWLKLQEDKFSWELEMKDLVIEVMSFIRFPMMTPRELADLLLCPLIANYKDFFVERLSIGMSFHSGQISRIRKVLEEEDGYLLFTPRLYIADSYSTLLTIEDFHHLPTYHTRTLVFSSNVALAEHAGDKTCEWIVDVHPKGVWFKKFYLIGWQGMLEVPEYVLRIFRLSITCKDPEALLGEGRIKIGIVIYGTQDGIEHVRFVYHRNHYFTDREKVLNLDNLLTFDQLNVVRSWHCSTYLVGPNRDVFKMHIIIEPLDDLVEESH